MQGVESSPDLWIDLLVALKAKNQQVLIRPLSFEYNTAWALLSGSLCYVAALDSGPQKNV
jgi:hypothetical protein